MSDVRTFALAALQGLTRRCAESPPSREEVDLILGLLGALRVDERPDALLAEVAALRRKVDHLMGSQLGMGFEEKR